MKPEIKWTHLALHVSNIEESVKFYAEFTGFKKIHDRFDKETQIRVVWLSDRPEECEYEFVLVLIEKVAEPEASVQSPIGPLSHIGFSVPTRADVDSIALRGKQRDILTFGPVYLDEVAGYICMLKDPDGHQVEFSFGQVLG